MRNLIIILMFALGITVQAQRLHLGILASMNQQQACGSVYGVSTDENDFTDFTGTTDLRGQQVTVTEDSFINSISLWHNGLTNTSNLMVGIYSDNGANQPDQRIGVSHIQQATMAGWNTLDLAESLFVKAGTKIWLCYLGEGVTIKFNVDATRLRAESTGTYSSYEANVLPQTFDLATTAQYAYAIYANYTCGYVIPTELKFITKSRNSVWVPWTIVKSGGTLTWTATNIDGTSYGSQNVNQPNFDFSGNTLNNDIIITVSSPDGWSGLTQLDFWVPNDPVDGGGSQIIAADIRAANALTVINFRYCRLEAVDFSQQTSVTEFTARGRGQFKYGLKLPPSYSTLDFVQVDGTYKWCMPEVNGYTAISEFRYYDIIYDNIDNFNYANKVVNWFADTPITNGNLVITNGSDPFLYYDETSYVAGLKLTAKGWNLNQNLYGPANTLVVQDDNIFLSPLTGDLAGQSLQGLWNGNGKGWVITRDRTSDYTVDTDRIDNWTQNTGVYTDMGITYSSSFDMLRNGLDGISTRLNSYVYYEDFATANVLTSKVAGTKSATDLILNATFRDVSFNYNEDKAFLSNDDEATPNIGIYQFSYSSSKTLTSDGVSLDLSGSLESFDFSIGGTMLVTLNNVSDFLTLYKLDAPYDLSTAKIIKQLNMSALGYSVAIRAKFSQDGSKIYVINSSNIYQLELNNYVPQKRFDTSTGWSLDTGATVSGGTLNIVSAGEYVSAFKNIRASAGDTYYYEFDLTVNSGSVQINVGDDSNNAGFAAYSTTGAKKGLLYNLGTDASVILKRNTACNVAIDNLIVYRIDGFNAIQGNAASSGVEYNGTTGMTSSLSAVITSDATAPKHKTYSLKIVGAANATASGYTELRTEQNTSYTIGFWAKGGASLGSQQVRLTNGWTTTPITNVTTSDWAYYEITGITTSDDEGNSPDVNFYPRHTTGLATDEIHIDKVSVWKTTPDSFSPDKFINGDFITSTGLNLYGNASISNFELAVQMTTGNYDYFLQKNFDGIWKNGKKYRVEFTVTNYVQGAFNVEFGSSNAVASPLVNANGTYSFDMTYDDTYGTYFYLRANSASPTKLRVDNLTVKEILN